MHLAPAGYARYMSDQIEPADQRPNEFPDEVPERVPGLDETPDAFPRIRAGSGGGSRCCPHAGHARRSSSGRVQRSG